MDRANTLFEVETTTAGGTGKVRERYLNHRYGGTQRLVDALERRLVASLLGGIPRPLCVLDIPSGYGRFTPQLRELTGGCLVSSDISRKRLGASAREEPQPKERLAFVQADLSRWLPFAPNAFDLVFNVRYLHHVGRTEERHDVLRELVRVSRRWVLASYYAWNLPHGLLKHSQFLQPKRPVTPMPRRRELLTLFAALDCRVVADRALLPGLHAQRVVLLEKSGRS